MVRCLEDQNPCEHLFAHVIRRVGGLEADGGQIGKGGEVIRRVGGLEVLAWALDWHLRVIRRVGGLEASVD